MLSVLSLSLQKTSQSSSSLRPDRISSSAHEMEGIGETVWGKFSKGPPIPGLQGNLQFMIHQEGDGKEGDELVWALCRHLLLNNVESKELHIICNVERRVEGLLSSERAQILRNIPISSIREGAMFLPSVTILVLSKSADPNYKGEISLPLHLSRVGVVIIASLDFFTQGLSQKWKEELKEFEAKGMSLSRYITTHCKTHNVCSLIKSGKELRELAPLGGCRTPCGIKTCGHPCPLVCHPVDIFDTKDNCTLPCLFLCLQGHPCLNLCNEPCACSMACPFMWDCGHPLINKKNCAQKCDFVLPCGHDCPKGCPDKNCTPASHADFECSQRCSRTCGNGHSCGGHPCSTPCPPCQFPMQKILHCRHIRTYPCSQPLSDLRDWVCKEPCTRVMGACLHDCQKLCYEECGVCERMCARRNENCGHLMVVPCCTILPPPCLQLVIPLNKSICGHKLLVPCHSRSASPEELSLICSDNCDSTTICGHPCPGECSQCFQHRFHVRCREACDRVLFCGHRCRVPCSITCPPCREPCLNGCEHDECPHECGVPCEVNCGESCPYSCPHSGCSKRCGEICDKEGCQEPCPIPLPCGHSCIGFCGEHCPRVCPRCEPETTQLYDFACNDEGEPRYIQLPLCGHIVEHKSLEHWLQISLEGEEIRYSTCPVCLKGLGRSLRRYSALINQAWDQVEEVKRRVYGDEKEILQILMRSRTKTMEQRDRPSHFKDFSNKILQELDKPFYTEKHRFIEWATDMWIEAEETMAHYDTIWYNRNNVATYHSAVAFSFQRIASREWPLYPDEMNCIYLELQRVEDMATLYNCVSLEKEDTLLVLADSKEGRKRFKDCEEVLLRYAPYDQDLQGMFKNNLGAFVAIQRYTLRISDKEREEIVRAFGSKAGRWFKCPNGHVYVVTECGGATEIGRCNECEATIGGVDHRVVDQNTLASEMDGAEDPMYPTALTRYE